MSNVNAFEGRPEKQARWDTRYIGLAHHIAQWSKDPRAKVGAVLVNQPQARVVATGFNGFPSNVEDSAERLQDKATKLRMMVHAEQNALLHAGHNARGCDAYVVGKPVCNTCATLLIQAGVRRVVAAAPREGTDSYWDRVGLLSIAMLREAGVEFIPISGPQLDALGLNRDEARAAEDPFAALQAEFDFGLFRAQAGGPQAGGAQAGGAGSGEGTGQEPAEKTGKQGPGKQGPGKQAEGRLRRWLGQPPAELPGNQGEGQG